SLLYPRIRTYVRICSILERGSVMATFDSGDSDPTPTAGLTDSSRKSPRGPYRHAYTEAQFDRRLRDEAALPLLEEAVAGPPLRAREIALDGACELLESMGLSRRQALACRRKLEGCPVKEIAEELGISVRRVYGILQEAKEIVAIRLAGGPADERPDSRYA